MSQTLKATLLALRPQQWAKNLLLFLAPFAAGVGFGPNLVKVFLGFIVFCLAASFGYIINDLIDKEIDMKHPKKKSRPFAAGILGVKAGFLIALVLIFLLSLLLHEFPLKFNVLVGIYIVNTFLYTCFFKKIPVIEMFAVTAGFVLRLIAGAIVINLNISEWFLIVGGFGALFMISTKRLAEFRLQKSQEVRSVIKTYSVDFLQATISISVSVSITAYTLWAFSQSVNSIWFQISVIPFVIAFFRYRWISESNCAEAPEEAIFGDKPMLILGFCCLSFLAVGIY